MGGMCANPVRTPVPTDMAFGAVPVSGPGFKPAGQTPHTLSHGAAALSANMGLSLVDFKAVANFQPPELSNKSAPQMA